MELPKVLIAISTEEKDRIQSIIDQHDRLNELTEFVALDSEHYHIRVVIRPLKFFLTGLIITFLLSFFPKAAFKSTI